MTAVVLSAVFGGYDRPKPVVAQTVPTRWMMVTDDCRWPAAGWEYHDIGDLYAHLPPRRAAKIPKCNPFDWVPEEDEFVVWIDASIQVLSPELVETVHQACPYGGVAAFRHPARDCIYLEAAHSIGMPKYKGEPIMEQVAAYGEAGWAHHAGLFACGVIGFDWSEKVQAFGRAWYDEIAKWSTQDQLSFPVIADRYGIDVGVIPGNLLSNDLVRVIPHPEEWR